MPEDTEPMMADMLVGRKKGDVWQAYGSVWEHHGEFSYADDDDNSWS